MKIVDLDDLIKNITVGLETRGLTGSAIFTEGVDFVTNIIKAQSFDEVEYDPEYGAYFIVYPEETNDKVIRCVPPILKPISLENPFKVRKSEYETKEYPEELFPISTENEWVDG